MNIIITCTATGPQLSSFSIMIIIFIIINIIVIVIFSDAGLYKCRVDFYRAPTQISEVALSVIGDQSSRSPSPKKICEEVFSLLMFGVKSQFGQIWQLSAWTLLVRREMVFFTEKGVISMNIIIFPFLLKVLNSTNVPSKVQTYLKSCYIEIFTSFE